MIRISLIFCNMKVCCVFSLDSNEYTQYPIFNIKKENNTKFANLQPRDYFLGTQERVRNIRGKRDISVFEPLKFYCIYLGTFDIS